jgi:uncharacterized protein YndB with AHSA1/START domain
LSWVLAAWLFALVARSFAGAWAQAPPRSALTSSERARLAAGEVLSSLRPAPEGGPQEGIGQGVIDVPPERVFRALTDYAHWQEFMPFLERSDAKPLPDGGAESQHVLDLPAPTGERRYKVRLQSRVEETTAGKRWNIDWKAVPGFGNLKTHRGSWVLTEFAPGRTLAVCILYTDPGGFTPNWAMNSATRKMLDWIFKGLRQQVNRGRYLEP